MPHRRDRIGRKRIGCRVTSLTCEPDSMKYFHTIIPSMQSILSCTLYLLLLSAVHAETPEEPKSIFWEPHRYDGKTTGLFHFDEEETNDVEAGLEDAESVEDKGLENDLLGGGKSDGRTASNAVMSGVKIELLGDCRGIAGQGRFGGGLFFEGTDGRIVGELPGGGRTIEFWMRPEKPAADGVTIVHVSAPPLKGIVLRLRPDEALELDWAGQIQTVPGYKFLKDQWTHVALAWDGRERCEFRLDGDLVSFDRPLLPAGTGNLTLYVLGNNPKGGNGFRGVLDEVRTSSEIREFYPRTFGWTMTDGGIKAKEGRPYFRDADDLLFHLNFNRTVTPSKEPKGTAAPDEMGDARKRRPYLDPEKPRPPFTEGIEGQSAIVGKEGTRLAYSGLELLSPDSGSIAFWIRPINWNNYVLWNPFAPFGQKSIRVFEILAGEKDRIGHFTLIQTPHNEAWQHPVDINPGRWIHLCMTWEKERRAFYLDGKSWPYWGAWGWEIKPFNTNQELTLKFGRDASQCAMDDFRIYRRALAPSEAANLAALFDPRQEVLPLKPIDMVVDYNGILGRVDVQLYPLSVDYAKVDNALITVIARDAAEPIGQEEFKFEGRPETRGRVETPPMEFTTYEVRAIARDAAGKTVCEVTSTFERKPPPWWQNKIGVTDKVMPGWSPVEVKDKTLSVVRRDIRFSDSGLPESLISAGEEILAGPIALTATTGGKAQPLQPVAGSFKAKTRGEVRADFTGESTGAGITASIKGYIEFDGMMWFSVGVTPSGVVGDGSGPGKTTAKAVTPTIDSLTLTIPYTEDASRLLHWWSGAHGFRNPRVVNIGATPEGEGEVFSSLDNKRVTLHGNMRGSFMPYVMLTGDRRGMAWFAENDQGWTQSMETPGVAIRRDGKTVSLVLSIISESVTIDKPRTFEFGLHPIPVKELQQGFRMTPMWGVQPDSFCGFNLKGSQATQFNRHPENMDWEMVAQRYRGELGSQGAAHREPQFNGGFRRQFGRDPKPHEQMVAGLYHDLSGIHAFPEHTREWGGEVWWSRKYTPEMIDYCAWIWNEWVRRGFARGIYYDNCFNYPMDAWPSPVSYQRPDGTVQPGFQWRQKREHMKRTRQIFHDNGLVPHLCAHTTHTNFIPYHSFFDVILDGEDFYTTAGQNRDFMDSWTPSRIRFMNSEKWGLTSTWLGWYAGTGGNWNKYQTMFWQRWRTYTAALLANDIVWTVNHMGGRHEVDNEWIKESKLCLDPDTEFLPSWESKVATHAHQNLYVSAWKRDGLCAVAVVNWSKERIEAEVKLALKAMGFGDAAADAVAVKDVDTSLLRYFDEDLTRQKIPDAEDLADAGLLKTANAGDASDLEAGAGNEEDELDELGFKKKVTLKDRKEKDPDGKFTWSSGILKCPVRPHDFRLFEFRLRDVRP